MSGKSNLIVLGLHSLTINHADRISKGTSFAMLLYLYAHSCGLSLFSEPVNPRFSLIFSMGLQLATPFIIVFIVLQVGFGLIPNGLNSPPLAA